MLTLVQPRKTVPQVAQRPAKPEPFLGTTAAQRYEAEQILACFETELELEDDNEGF